MTPRAVAVVCAKNERDRIGRVLNVLVPMLPTLVIDDGSTDGTSIVASHHGALVTRLPRNVGKGQAMRIGAWLSHPAPVVLFADADLVGLRPDHVRRMLDPVLRGSHGMVVGLRDYGRLNPMVRRLPLISGERAVRREVLAAMPPEGWQGYGVETFLNHAAARSGLPVGTTLLDGLRIVPKWDKVGPQEGARQMADMAAEVARAHALAARQDARARGMGMTAGAGDVLPAPLPPSLTSPSSSTDDVLRELSRHVVEASVPHVREHLWTEEAQRRVGSAVGRRVAAPLWALGTAACYLAFGPVAGTMVSIAGIVDGLRKS